MNTENAVQATAEVVKQTYGVSVLTIARIIITIGVIAAVIVLFYILKKIFAKYKTPTEGLSKERVTVIRVIYSVIRLVVLVGAILFILQVCGVNVSGAIAGLGIASAIVALAVQDLLKDLIMGANIISEHYFSIGDCVELDGARGKVVGLSMRSTKIEGYDNSITTVQNHYISKIKKVSEEHYVYIPAPYELDSAALNELMGAIAKEAAVHKGIKRCVYAGIDAYNESSLSCMFKFYCDPFLSLSLRREINNIAYKEFEKRGIAIPYNRLIVEYNKQRPLDNHEDLA